MSEYELTVGAPKGDANGDLYNAFDALNVTRTASSVNSWSATLPFPQSFADDVLKDVWIYHEGEIIFRGKLEAFDVDIESGTVDIDGRGIFVEMTNRTDVVTYSNTTVYDAIYDWWSTRQWDALVLPPNRDVFNELYSTTQDMHSLWTWDGDAQGDLLADDLQGKVAIENQRVKFLEQNVKLDDHFGTNETDQTQTIYPPTATDEIFLIVETSDAVESITGGMKVVSGSSDTPAVAEEYVTNSYNTNQTLHLFKFEFGSNYERFRPTLEIGNYTTDIVNCEVFISDKSDYVEIDSVELDGNEFEVIQDLHDLGSYEFVVADYENLDVRSFPVGTVAGEPDWDILSANRSLDYSDYANKVTIHGKTKDDGTTNTATREDTDEISALNSRGVGDNGVVEAFEKNTDLETQSEVDTRADRFLEESVDERDESGSLDIAPKRVTPGYSYNVSVWGDAFPDGLQIGSNSLYFDGSSHVEFEFSENTFNNSYTTWEFLIHPQGLEGLAPDEYQTIYHHDYSQAEKYVRLYGDGSVSWDVTSLSYDEKRTQPDVIQPNVTQRLTIQGGTDPSTTRCLVNGQVRHEESQDQGFHDYFEATHYIGNHADGNSGFIGGIDDVRFTDQYSWPSEGSIRRNAFEDLIEAGVNLSGTRVYLRFDQPGGGLVNDGTEPYFSGSVQGAEYQSAYGQLEEVQHSLGTGETVSLDFDISGRIDTELVSTQKSARVNRRSL